MLYPPFLSVLKNILTQLQTNLECYMDDTRSRKTPCSRAGKWRRVGNVTVLSLGETPYAPHTRPPANIPRAQSVWLQTSAPTQPPSADPCPSLPSTSPRPEARLEGSVPTNCFWTYNGQSPNCRLYCFVCCFFLFRPSLSFEGDAFFNILFPSCCQP